MEERVATSQKTVDRIVGQCEKLYLDLELGYVAQWKERKPGRKAVGYLPIFIPREIIHAAGILPVGIMGGGDQLEIIRGDSYFQSYICHIPRSVIELGLLKKLDVLDGMLFPSTCDVIRNLSGMWKMLFPTKYVRYFDVPQNFDSAVGGHFYEQELKHIQDDLVKLGGREVTSEMLFQSIGLYNQNRKLISDLYALRQEKPWLVPTVETYLLLRAGNILDVEEHNQMLEEYLASVIYLKRRPLDNCRVILRGVFCEQPPLDLIRTLERAGCYIVGDDFVLISRWIQKQIPLSGNPLTQLSEAYLWSSIDSAVKYDQGNKKEESLVAAVKSVGADGVIFCAPSFCDPALLEQPLLVSALEKQKIPYTQFKYSENSGQFQAIREQAGTFSDSVKLWGAA